jgi:hypothetical protein
MGFLLQVSKFFFYLRRKSYSHHDTSLFSPFFNVLHLYQISRFGILALTLYPQSRLWDQQKGQEEVGDAIHGLSERHETCLE